MVGPVAFLWSLLPGAREARNQVLIGYAWLAAIALWVGVPSGSGTGHLHDLIDALGKIGVGIVVSFGAFLIGSLFEDVTAPFLRIRQAKAFTSGAQGGLDLLEAMGEAGRRDLERLEGSIDRNSAEISLRLGLLVPLLIGTVAGVVGVAQHGSIKLTVASAEWGIAFVAVAAALGFQVWRRRVELNQDLAASADIRNDAQNRLARGRGT
jgi:hypothetical protein